MIPYFQLPSLGPIHPFGVLVALGILLGVRQVVRRGQQLGLDPLDTSTMATVAIVVAFVVSHLFDALFYQTDRLWAQPTLRERLWFLLSPTEGISSFGGFLGALLGGGIWCLERKSSLLKNADASVYGLATGWLFGRIGCFTAHDHRGAHTDFFLGVRFPDGTRHDLGLYEALFTAALLVAFRLLARAPRPAGFYLALGTITYAPARFLFDFLREGDERYFGLTPAQYGSILLFLVGVVTALRVWRAPPTAPTPTPPPVV